MSDEIKERAEKQAGLVIKEAEIKAERVLAQAMARATKVENAITEIKILRNQMRQRLQATLAMVENVLTVQGEEEAEEEKVRFLRKGDDSLDAELRK